MMIENKEIKCFNPSKDDINIEKRKKIYHYTSPSGLSGILGNATIRFTDCQFLNDKSEYTHIINPLTSAINELKGETEIDLEDILLHIQENYEAEDVEIDRKEFRLTLSLNPKRYYVFCASTAADSLEMWNYYVKDGAYQGYNIGFSIEKLLDCFSSIQNPQIDVVYGKVIYREKEQIGLLKDMLLAADAKYREKIEQPEGDVGKAHERIIGEILNYIEDFRLFFKNEAFSNEKEYRFILKLPLKYAHHSDDPIVMGYRIRNGIFTPYCELAIDKEKTITSIFLSPMLEGELAKQGLKRYLKHSGYDNKINIVQSRVPIRY